MDRPPLKLDHYRPGRMDVCHAGCGNRRHSLTVSLEYTVGTPEKGAGDDMEPSAAHKLRLARHHLNRVQNSWDTPTDWDDLSLYGFFALEAAVDCVCLHFGIAAARTHSARSDAAKDLALQHGIDDISDLLRDLNEARKSAAYGDVDDPPELDAEDVATRIETYIESITELVESGGAR